MPGSFSSQTYNIAALLGRTSFPSSTPKPVIVPTFQRGFSWEAAHISAFWEDVSAFHDQLGKKESQDTYFLGPIVFLPGIEKVELLDGQQRLATATILVAVIRDIARAKGGQAGSDLARDIQRDLIMVDDEKDLLALTLGELDAPFFRSTVQQDPPNTTIRPRLRSHRLIQQARTFLHTRVSEMIDGLETKELVAKLKALQRTVASHIKLVGIEVLSEEEAYFIFETLNDRGLRLAVPDLVLNYLMRTATSDPDRTEIRQQWNSIIEGLGQNKVSTFIRHMWVSRFGDVKSQGLFREIRTNRSMQELGSVGFVRLCATEAEQYIAILQQNPDKLGQEAVGYAEAIVKHLDAEYAIPLLLSGLASLTSTDFAKLARIVEIVVTRYSVLADLNPSSLETAMYTAARTIRTNREATIDSRHCLQEAKVILRKINPPDNQLLTAAAAGKILSRRQAAHLVYRLADHYQSSAGTINLKTSSIEHIFPENAETANWPDADNMQHLVWHLGNLTLLEPTLNRDAGSRVYSEKLKIYPRSEIRITKEIPSHYTAWDASQILKRAEWLVTNLCTRIWPETF